MNTKTILIIVAVILVLCLCGCIVGFALLSFGGQAMVDNLVVSNPEEVGAAASEIAEYELPSGYQEEGVINFFFGKMLMIGPDAQSSFSTPMIVIMQLSVPVEDADAVQMRQQMQQSIERSLSQQEVQFEYMGTTQVQINGQEVNLHSYEGTTADGALIHQAVTDFFNGRSGTLMVMATGTDANWDQAEIETFLGSIH